MPIVEDRLTGWAQILVGHQWPSLSSVSLLSTGTERRQSTSHEYDTYADQLQHIRRTYLATQEGIAATSADSRFDEGESHSRNIAHKNRAKAEAYKLAQDAASQLRSDLQQVVDAAEKRIRAVLDSKVEAAAKVHQILEVVTEAQSQANVAAASQANNVLDAIQRVLNVESAGLPARQFAAGHGASLGGAFSSLSNERLKSEIQTVVGGAVMPPLSPENMNGSENEGFQERILDTAYDTSLRVPADPQQLDRPTIFQSSDALNKAPETASDFNSQTPSSGRSPDATTMSFSASSTPLTAVTTVDEHPSTVATTIGSPTLIGNNSTSVTTPATATQANAIGTRVPSGSASLLSSGDVETSAAKTSAALATTHPLATQFNNGAHAGAPLSAGAEAIVSTATSFHAPLTPAPALPADVPFAATAPTLFATAHAAPLGGESPLSAVPAEAAHPVVAPAAAAMPTAPASPPLISPVTPSVPPPAGLIGYGADLRPAVATPPPAPVAPSAVPGSAPVTPAGGSTGLGQSAVVRQPQGTAAPSNPAPAVLTENAIAATAAGAAAGASTARAQAEHRLTRLLHSAARQQPRLRWIIGERQDGSTVLATDLAGGWIPPHIDIPAAVTLLSPAVRSESLQRLVRPAELACIYRPGDHLSADEAKPVPASIRARDTPAVIDLAWELAQATKWRDGLPRLAHTLVKAVFAGTGYLDTEVDLLDQHLATVSDRVLKAYPDNVDRDEVANWQLLATIDALIKGHNTVANYHFAWFRTQTMTPEGEAHA